MKSLIAIAVCVAAASAASAQYSSVAPLLPVERHQLPAALQKQIPTHGPTRLFGVSKLVFKGGTVFVDVYDIGPTIPRNGETDPDIYYGNQNCGFDLLVRHKTGMLQQIESVPFGYVRFVNTRYPSNERVSASVTWLDPKQKQVPVFIIDLQADGVEGPCGTNVLVVFPDGLSGKAVLKSFDYGADNSSEHNDLRWSFDGIDSNGYLTIEARHSTMGSDTRVHWEWRSKHFVTVKMKTTTREY